MTTTHVDRKQAGARSSAAGAGVILVLLIPLWFDTLAFGLFAITRSRTIYSAVLVGFELTAAMGAIFFARAAWSILRGAFNWRFILPAILYSASLVAVLASGSDNQEFILAALRYLPWLIFVTGFLGWEAARRRATKANPECIISLKFLEPVAAVLAVLAAFQWALSPWISESLSDLQKGLMSEGRTNAVMTSIDLGKSFASLTLRNPIELGYIGVFLLCIGAARAGPRSLILTGLTLVAAGRSNTTFLAALSVLTVQAVADSKMATGRRFMLAVSGLLLLGLAVSSLPWLYLGAGANWDYLIDTLGMQRLGLVIALPALIEESGARMLLSGIPLALEPLVEDLFAAGLLPELFAEGGSIAVFDILWFGMLLVGGLPFVLGGLALLRTCGPGRGAFQSAARLYALAAFIVAFSSQVLLSRYGLYFFCALLAAAAVERNSTPRN